MGSGKGGMLGDSESVLDGLMWENAGAMFMVVGGC